MIYKFSKFQSQNGLILVRCGCYHHRPLTCISIPKWSDFSANRKSHQQELNDISIPKWSDFSSYADQQYQLHGDISIPKWSDFSD